MKDVRLDEISLRLQAPKAALKKIVQGKFLPKIFALAALSELEKAEECIKKQNPPQDL